MTQPALQSSNTIRGIKHLSRCRAVVALSGPLAIGIVFALSMLVMYSFNITAHRGEMLAATIISVVAGVIAVLPMLALMNRGLIAIVRLTMLAMALRIVFMLAGLILAAGPGWKLSLVPLVAWTGAFYLTLLIAESSATAWVVRHG